jgi:large subunit ribosomal protein L24
MFRVKKNDRVKVLAGKDKGKEGSVISLQTKTGKVLVKGVGLITRHVKARKPGQVSAIKTEEQFIDGSKVMPICTSCKQACRVNIKLLENDKRARTCNRCKEIF